MKVAKRIIISRTDGIGDVVLSLPVAGVLKYLNPDHQIILLGKSYTKPIGEACKYIDEFVNWTEITALSPDKQLDYFRQLKADIIIHVFPVKEIAKLSKKAGIPIRVGATGRLYHYTTCNKLVRLSRRRSPCHEAQLNLKLIRLLGAKDHYNLDEIIPFFGLNNFKPLAEEFNNLINASKFNLILHPKSKGSAREWNIEHFNKLIDILPQDRFQIYITGTEAEGNKIRTSLIDKHKDIVDLTGKLSLDELISFISKADGIIAASTGPLHIGAALGKVAVGIYPPIQPMHPGRWAPVGEHATYLVLDKECSECRIDVSCACMQEITPEMVMNKLMEEVA